jgi:hypothetical protein
VSSNGKSFNVLEYEVSRFEIDYETQEIAHEAVSRIVENPVTD